MPRVNAWLVTDNGGLIVYELRYCMVLDLALEIRRRFCYVSGCHTNMRHNLHSLRFENWTKVKMIKFESPAGSEWLETCIHKCKRRKDNISKVIIH